MRQLVLLLVESVDNNSHKQVEDEERSKDEVDYKEQDVDDGMVSLLNLIDLCGVKSIPHHIYPPLSGHHIEHGDHGIAHIVKVLLIPEPVATIVHTVPLRDNLVLNRLWDVSHVTVVKLSLEESDSLDTKQHQNQGRYHHQISDAWH